MGCCTVKGINGVMLVCFGVSQGDRGKKIKRGKMGDTFIVERPDDHVDETFGEFETATGCVEELFPPLCRGLGHFTEVLQIYGRGE